MAKEASKEIAKQNGGTAVSNQMANPFLSYGESEKQTAIVGKLLKFSKGDWFAGQEDELVEDGSTFIANMDELLTGWVRWSDNKPTDHVMGKVVLGYQPPRRNELGDTDSDAWDIDEKGVPRDPWQATRYLLLQGMGEDEEQLFTFTTSSTGGKNAIGDLCLKYGKQLRQHGADYPVIKIGSGSYMHSNKSFGRIKYPTLTIVGWIPKSAFVDVAEAERSSEVDDDAIATAEAAAVAAENAQLHVTRQAHPAEPPPARAAAGRAKGKGRF